MQIVQKPTLKGRPCPLLLPPSHTSHQGRRNTCGMPRQKGPVERNRSQPPAGHQLHAWFSKLYPQGGACSAAARVHGGQPRRRTHLSTLLHSLSEVCFAVKLLAFHVCRLHMPMVSYGRSLCVCVRDHAMPSCAGGPGGGSSKGTSGTSFCGRCTSGKRREWTMCGYAR